MYIGVEKERQRERKAGAIKVFWKTLKA